MKYVITIYSHYDNKARAIIRKANSQQEVVHLCEAEGYSPDCIIAITEVD